MKKGEVEEKEQPVTKRRKVEAQPVHYGGWVEVEKVTIDWEERL